ncbi:MAG: tripartite tricarboxylate transporter substrate binding protein [Polaromonas sp.]|uniref:Bug family tripartite tricarboxylate transporter substrate binding protein n=1 Tax=Polaromonas sp. TaxID=1869339 RepID=UPI002734DC04|nr:tripartite tricarboxylate transporter substrate binding protein [Polaromonas sp.]MDP2818104.1 tripartite tricarboxylate transporter substrate binding protein [Polaromonas sp.]
MLRRKFFYAGAQWSVALAAPSLLLKANAQTGAFPTKGLRVVVPFAPGGATDATARLIGEKLSRSLGQSVIIDNKTGAAGAIGCAEVAKAPADGYTLLYTLNDPLINNTVLIKNLPYDPQRDFRFVASILRSPALLSVPASLGVKNFEEFKAYAAAAGRQVSYGSWGIGSLGHLAGQTLGSSLKFNSVHVPQRGEAPVLQDLLTNTINCGWTSAGTARPHVLGNKIVPLAMMGVNRSSALPNVPTFRELGITDNFFDRSVWMAVLVPKATPDTVVARLSTEIQAIANSAEVIGAIRERGLEPMITGADRALAMYNEEFPVITKRLRDLGIEPS